MVLQDEMNTIIFIIARECIYEKYDGTAAENISSFAVGQEN
jgi:hypothetical protein